MAAGPGPLDDPILPKGEDPIVNPIYGGLPHRHLGTEPPLPIPMVPSAAAATSKPNSVLGQLNLPANVGPGPFARESIPAGPLPKPSAQQQLEINRLFDLYGCHMCGTKDAETKWGDAVGDHQPPTGLNLNNDTQRYYPQCIHCMRGQGVGYDGSKP